MGDLFGRRAGDAAPLLDVKDVVGPFGRYCFRSLEDLRVMQRAADGIRRVVPRADHLLDFLVQTPIAEHLQVGREDGRVVVAQLARRRSIARFAAGGPIADRVFQLVPRRRAHELRGMRTGVTVPPRHGHAGRNGIPVVLHVTLLAKANGSQPGLWGPSAIDHRPMPGTAGGRVAANHPARCVPRSTLRNERRRPLLFHGSIFIEVARKPMPTRQGRSASGP
jgi:hypothetical protein